MQKCLRSIVTAIVSGLVFLMGAVFILMEIGRSRFDNYKFYGNYWPLYVLPGVVGLVLPSIVAWILRQDDKDSMPVE